jgi:CO/xanthine dehydrogenase Mo-binding subunit
MVYDPNNGAALNQWFLDLKTPVSVDVPTIEPVLIELGNEGHPFGAKGCSEAPLVGVAPAVRNAIYNATGARLDEIPLTPDRVLAALRAASRAPHTNGTPTPTLEAPR